MRRGGRREAKIEEVEEDDENQNLSKSSVAGVSEDDDEGNEDLSLKIVENSLMRATKLDRNNTNVLVLEDPSLGSGNDSAVVELPLSSSSLAVDAGSNGTKKKRRKKIKAQIADQSVIISNEEKIAETTEEVETIDEVPAVEIVEADDANAGDVPVNAVMQKLLRGLRYFDAPASGGWSSCYNCGEEGHMTANCPSFTKKKKPCFVCGSLDHISRQCHKDKDCFICKQVGHRAKDCPEKHKVVSKICLRCGNSGHHMFSCSAEYSHDDLKEIQCYICKSYGHLCCANYVDDSSIEVSCYICGNLGHTGLSCSRLHEENISNASPSFCYKCGGGHFARECSNYTRFYDEGAIPSLSLCYKCGEGGNFARECRSSAKTGKRNHELSTPSLKAHTDIKDNDIGVKSAPHDLGKKRKRKTISEQKSTPTPPKENVEVGGLLRILMIYEDQAPQLHQNLDTEVGGLQRILETCTHQMPNKIIEGLLQRLLIIKLLDLTYQVLSLLRKRGILGLLNMVFSRIFMFRGQGHLQVLSKGILIRTIMAVLVLTIVEILHQRRQHFEIGFQHVINMDIQNQDSGSLTTLERDLATRAVMGRGNSMIGGRNAPGSQCIALFCNVLYFCFNLVFNYLFFCSLVPLTFHLCNNPFNE